MFSKTPLQFNPSVWPQPQFPHQSELSLMDNIFQARKALCPPLAHIFLKWEAFGLFIHWSTITESPPPGQNQFLHLDLPSTVLLKRRNTQMNDHHVSHSQCIFPVKNWEIYITALSGNSIPKATQKVGKIINMSRIMSVSTQ